MKNDWSKSNKDLFKKEISARLSKLGFGLANVRIESISFLEKSGRQAEVILFAKFPITEY